MLVGSDGGKRTDPAWVHNLTANPAVVVQIRDDAFGAVAHLADPTERPRLWDLMVALFPTYAAYEKKARRELPVVILERR